MYRGGRKGLLSEKRESSAYENLKEMDSERDGRVAQCVIQGALDWLGARSAFRHPE